MLQNASSKVIKKVSELDWFSMKPEAGRWLEICLPDADAKSAGEPSLAV